MDKIQYIDQLIYLLCKKYGGTFNMSIDKGVLTLVNSESVNDIFFKVTLYSDESFGEVKTWTSCNNVNHSDLVSLVNKHDSLVMYQDTGKIGTSAILPEISSPDVCFKLINDMLKELHCCCVHTA
ncbi:MAG: hypothetical protein K6G88_11145 [Lachnospiraceae bacterium]|nr:hypothetical protein [Lachnospiraceae bacterium]